MTIGERKIMGSMQRREGRNIVGYKGILQAIADGEKLIIKEMIERIGSERIGLYIGPIILFIISLYPYMLIEYSRGIVIKESNIGIIIILGIMGIGIYGVIIGG
jgi:NADH-quinone oxidoreductase subunit H